MWRRGLALAEARPERYLVFTLAGKIGEGFPAIRNRMKDLRYDIQHTLGDCEWAWTVEHNPKRTGYHVNAYQRGAYLPQARLAELADGAGLGAVAWIEQLRATATGTYGLKEALGYGMKEAQAQEQGAAYLAMNGGRLTHQSRSFFDGGVRAAEARGVARAQAGGDAQTWEIVSVAELHAALGSPAPRLTPAPSVGRG